jgi:hypothetical protein
MEAPAQPMSAEAFTQGVLDAKKQLEDALQLLKLDQLKKQKEANG